MRAPAAVWCLGLWLALALAGRAEPRLRLEPNPLLVGETGYLILEDDAAAPRLRALPAVPDLTWLDTTPRLDRAAAAYRFRVRRAGALQLPALTVVTNGVLYTLTPPGLTVQPFALAAADLRLTVRYDGAERPPARLYVGQALELQFELSVAETPQRRVADALFALQLMPVLEFAGEPLWRDYTGQNAYSRRFHLDASRRTLTGDTPQRSYVYTATVMPTAAGELRGRLTHEVPLVIDAGRRSTNPFLDRWHAPPERTVWVPLELPLPPLPVVPLPPAPPGAAVTGLVGEFELSVTLDRREVGAGAGAALTLAAQGRGSVERLAPVALRLPGFKVYDPAASFAGLAGTASLRWVLVPTAADSRLPELAFATFSPARQTWDVRRFQPELSVRPDDQAVADPRFARAARPVGAPGVRLPVWRNDLAMLLLLLGLGPAGWLGAEFVRARRQRLAARQGDRELAAIVAELQAAAPAAVPLLVSTRLLPYLRQRHGLPPGATLAEMSARLRQPELVRELTAIEHQAFMPAAARQGDRGRLLQALRQWAGVALVALLGGPLGSAELRPDFPPEAHYAQGRYAAAAAGYAALAVPGAAAVNLAFNQGNCSYLQGDYARALVSYERARRLAPRDRDVAGNLALTREQLGLAPAAPALWEYLRPDEWLRVAGLLWVLAWGLAAVGRWRRWRWAAWLAPVAVLGGCCLGAAWTEQVTGYHPAAAMAVAEAPVDRLPDVAGTRPGRLAVGDEVRLVEERDGWCRVRWAGGDGWVPARAVSRLLAP